MRGALGTCQLSEQQLITEYFMEQRNNVLDLAAFSTVWIEPASTTHPATSGWRRCGRRCESSVLTSPGGWGGFSSR